MAQIVKRGDNWLVRVFTGRDGNGKRTFINKTVKGAKKDAALFAARIETELSTGSYREPTKETLGDYLDKWLNGHASTVRERTTENYRYLLFKHIVPAIGH